MQNTEISCINYFKNEPVTKELYTQIWIELINQLENYSGNMQTIKNMI